jgi:hypothetical protein
LKQRSHKWSFSLFFFFYTDLFLADLCGFCFARAFFRALFFFFYIQKQIRVERNKNLQLQLENENGDRTSWHELETLAVKDLGPATRHKEVTVNSTSRELSSKAKAQNVFGIFRSNLIFGQKWTVGKEQRRRRSLTDQPENLIPLDEPNGYGGARSFDERWW